MKNNCALQVTVELNIEGYIIESDLLTLCDRQILARIKERHTVFTSLNARAFISYQNL